MAAKSIADVRAAMVSAKTATSFTAGFADAYFGQAFGVLPKAEIDFLVFRLLIEARVIDAAGSIFAIARALNITPTKARSLLFQYQLRYLDELATDRAVVASLESAKFSVDERRLSFGIESPLARATIDDRLKSTGVYADISLSGDILRVPLDQFDLFVTMLIGPERAKELEQALKKDGHLKKGSLAEWLKKYGGAAATGAAGAAGKESFSQFLAGVRQWISDDGVNALGDIISAAG